MANNPSSGAPAGSSKIDVQSKKGTSLDSDIEANRGRRPLRSDQADRVGGNKTGTNPGFTEEQTKDVEVSSGGGLAQDPDENRLRGEDQLVDGVVDEAHLVGGRRKAQDK
jgi:hypothetical protein